MRNKTPLLLCILITIFCFPSYTEDGWKWYFDYYNNYSGRATILYLGTTAECTPSQEASQAEAFLQSDIVGYCRKLSKTENFLIWSALAEYDYVENEVYGIVVQDAGNDTALTVVVQIVDNGKSFRWYGGFYTK